jgi:hypothetical protein
MTHAAVSALIPISRRIRHRVRHYRREAAAARCLIGANEYGNFEYCLSASHSRELATADRRLVVIVLPTEASVDCADDALSSAKYGRAYNFHG